MLPRAIHRPSHQPARPSLPLTAPLTAPTTGAEEIAERCSACAPNPTVLYGGWPEPQAVLARFPPTFAHIIYQVNNLSASRGTYGGTWHVPTSSVDGSLPA